MSLYVNDPIIVKRRKGIDGDEFLEITESILVQNNIAQLLEIPNVDDRVTVRSSNETYNEKLSSAGLLPLEYSVDYNNGLVKFNEVTNGLTLTFRYLGTGATLFPASRVYTKADGNTVTETIMDIIGNEDDRNANESIRQSQEETRQLQEDTRRTQEATRQFQETARMQDTATAIAGVADAINAAQHLVDNYDHLGEYNPSVTYVKNNEVRYTGETWRCLKQSIGNTPAENEFWTLVARKGADGAGAVDSVNGQSGIVTLTATDVGAETPSGAQSKVDKLNVAGIISVHDYGAVGDGIANDTTSVQNAINAAPEFSTIAFRNGKTYLLNSLNITKSLYIDLNGASLVVDPTTSGTNGNPVFWFRGSISGTSYSINFSQEGVSYVNLSSVSDAANFSVGDYVRLKDNKVITRYDGNTGYTGREEVNRIEAIDTVSGKITLNKPIEWSYEVTPTITKITKMLEHPAVNGARATITEVDPSGTYSGALFGNCPHIIHMQYCVEPTVSDCVFDKWNVHAINLQYCINAEVKNCSGYNPFRASSVNHGYFLRFDHCNGGVASRNFTRNVRHTIDYAQSYDSSSINNYSLGSIMEAFCAHGQGSKRVSSVNDIVVGGAVAGWAAGNSLFNADYGFDIINPKYTGDNVAIVAQANAENVKVIGGSIQTTKRALMITSGAKKVSMNGTNVKIINGDDTSPYAVLVRSSLADSAGAGDIPDVIDITSCIFSGNVTVSVASGGRVSVRGNKFDVNTPNNAVITIGSALSDLELVQNHIAGVCKWGIIVNVAPTNRYKVSDNTVRGHTTYGIGLDARGNLELTGNVTSDTSFTALNSSNFRTAVNAGALLFNNKPNDNDGMSNSTVGIQAVSSLPTPSVSNRSGLYVVRGANGTPDAGYVSVKLGDDTYQWIQLF